MQDQRRRGGGRLCGPARRGCRPAAALAVLAAVSVVAGGPAGLAQTASEITPPSFAPEPRRPVVSIVFGGAPGLGAPAGAETLTIAIGSVEIEGAFPRMAEANRAAVARLTSGRIRASEIFEAAQALEAAYARAGFVLARVVLPAQELRDGGRLRLVVVDGFVERIDTDAVPRAVRGRTDRVVSPLVGRRGLRLEEIERALLIAGDTFGLALDSTLARGDAPGATQLVLEGQHRTVSGFVGADRGLSRDLGEFTLDAGAEVNGVLGLAETLYLRFSAHPDGSALGATPRMRTMAAGAVVPVGRNGLTFTVEGVESRTTPQRAGPPVTSQFERLSLRLTYPVIRTRARTLTARLAFDLQDDAQDVLGAAGRIPVYRDRLRVVRLGATGAQTLGAGGQVEVDATLSLGLDGFGARTAAEATPALPLSRQGADAGFSKLALSVSMVRPLGARVVGAINLRGQTSFGAPLLKSEQISLAGAGLVSGLEPGSVVGDSGWVLRGELRMPIKVDAAPVPLQLTPYAFGAAGELFLHRPTALEQASTQVASIGVGLEMVTLTSSRFSSASARVEVAGGFRNDGQPDDVRLNLGASFRF